MYCCSERHVLRHGWHFPSWPKVLSAHCSLSQVFAALPTGAAGAAVLQQGSKEGRCKIAPCRFEVSATRPGSTNMELSVACLTCNANPLSIML